MKLITILLSIILTLSLTACNTSHSNQSVSTNQTTKHAQTQSEQLIIPFKVTSVSGSNYQAVPLKPNSDKPKVIFTQSDIEPSQQLIEGQLINVYYQSSKGEDTFLKVVPKDEYTAQSNLTQSFTITQVTDNTTGNDEYCGKSNTDDSQIYFTSDQVQSVGQLQIGDTVTAHFDNEEDDSLQYVSKVN